MRSPQAGERSRMGRGGSARSAKPEHGASGIHSGQPVAGRTPLRASHASPAPDALRACRDRHGARAAISSPHPMRITRARKLELPLPLPFARFRRGATPFELPLSSYARLSRRGAESSAAVAVAEAEAPARPRGPVRACSSRTRRAASAERGAATGRIGCAQAKRRAAHASNVTNLETL